MNYGYIKVATAVPHIKVTDCKFDAGQIEKEIIMADGKDVQITVFPELRITGYTCGDLSAQQFSLEEAEIGLIQTLNNTCQMGIISIPSTPAPLNGMLLNTVVVIQKGEILGVAPKIYLPNYREFYKKRWFAPACEVSETIARSCGQVVPMGRNLLFEIANTTSGIEICEDLWVPISPSSSLALQGAEIPFNLSADNEGIGKHAYLRSFISQQSARHIAGHVSSSCGFGESAMDVAFAGNGLIYENGTLLAGSERFSFEGQLMANEIDVKHICTERRINATFVACHVNCAPEIPVRISAEYANSGDLNLARTFEPHPLVPQELVSGERCEEVFSIQVSELAQHLVHTNVRSVVVGISGDLDSTLALLVCVKTFDKLSWDRKGIIGVTMPGFGITDHMYTDTVDPMTSLGVAMCEICIKNACIQHFKDIDRGINVHDVTYENSQARECTQILMDIANQTWGAVVGTDDLLGLALGWATYNGDHMSVYGVNGSIPKTLVKHLAKWVVENDMDEAPRATLLDVVDTPISPELIPAGENGNIKQIIEDLVGPYELHDFSSYYFLCCGFRPSKIFFLVARTFKDVYDEEAIRKWLRTSCRRFFNQQFKRSRLPGGPKVGSISISPCGDQRIPSDASTEMWLGEVETL